MLEERARIREMARGKRAALRSGRRREADRSASDAIDGQVIAKPCRIDLRFPER
jgi:hypothetical protein